LEKEKERTSYSAIVRKNRKKKNLGKKAWDREKKKK